MIETSRLILRPPLPDDFEAFANAQSDEIFKQHTGGTLNRAQAWEEFVGWREFWEIHDYCFFSVIEKSSGHWIGRVGPTRRANDDFQEMGWSIIPKYQGQGFAHEAIIAAIDWVCANKNWQNIIFRIGAANLNSQALAKKLGAINQGLEIPPKSAGKDIEVWTLNQ